MARTIRHLRKTGSEKRTRRRKEFAEGLNAARKRDLRSVKGEEYKWHKLGGKTLVQRPTGLRETGTGHAVFLEKKEFLEQGFLTI